MKELEVVIDAKDLKYLTVPFIKVYSLKMLVNQFYRAELSDLEEDLNDDAKKGLRKIFKEINRNPETNDRLAKIESNYEAVKDMKRESKIVSARMKIGKFPKRERLNSNQTAVVSDSELDELVPDVEPAPLFTQMLESKFEERHVAGVASEARRVASEASEALKCSFIELIGEIETKFKLDGGDRAKLRHIMYESKHYKSLIKS